MQSLCIEDRPIDAYAAIIPSITGLDGRHAAKADADAACHWRFQREMARYALALSELRECVQHRFGTAAENVLSVFVPIEQVGDEAMKAEAAVVAR